MEILIVFLRYLGVIPGIEFSCPYMLSRLHAAYTHFASQLPFRVHM
jgi:hypothetical protein